MKKFFILITIVLIQLNLCVLETNSVVLKTGISLTEQVPKGFFGSWKITSRMTYASNLQMFNKTSIDYWNLSKSGNVITLTNPISGAEASVMIEDVKDNQIRFSHITKGKNGKMIETPTLTLNGENFSGTDKIIVEKYKYGELISSDMVIYQITAEKISGKDVQEILSN